MDIITKEEMMMNNTEVSLLFSINEMMYYGKIYLFSYNIYF